MAKIPTVLVTCKSSPERGSYWINKSDYDPEIYNLVTGAENAQHHESLRNEQKQNESQFKHEFSESSDASNNRDEKIRADEPSSSSDQDDGNKRESENQEHLPAEEPRDLISINLSTATKEELIKVPSIGEVRAEKILSAQPFSSIEEFRAMFVFFGSNSGYYQAFKDYEVSV